MKKLLLVLFVALSFTSNALAQQFFANTQAKTITTSHATVGTSTAAAISSVGGNVISWKICNDAVNSPTYLFVGKAADAATDGVMLGKGACFECPNCVGATLSAMKVKAQGASNGYSVIQYRN